MHRRLHLLEPKSRAYCCVAGSCDRSAVFSPLTRACETPYSIPREHGGWRPSCEGRRDGKHPDQHGRCRVYYSCQQGLFTGFHSCPAHTVFDPDTSSCLEEADVVYPCGDQDPPLLCVDKPDGRYLDPHGRCTHYYTCQQGLSDGLTMCPHGIFNPITRSCDINADGVTRPCGPSSNPCFNKKDGYYRSEVDVVRDTNSTDVWRRCGRYHLCERGLLVAVFSCPPRFIFSDVDGGCVDVLDAKVPCDLA